MSSLRRHGRTIAIVGAAGVATTVGRHLYRSYRADMENAYATLNEADTETSQTSVGTVEYRTRGQGTPILVAHGIVGGFDQALQTGKNLFEGDGRLLGVSRFGYLGSDLPAEPTPESQARAYVELLDELGIENTVVVGTSAGGAPAIRFALEYPDRTAALVLIGSTAPREEDLEGPTGPPHVILRDPVFWFLVHRVPWVFLRLFGVDPDEYQAATPHERRRVDALLATLVPVEPRKAGIVNDARVTNTAMVERDDEYDLEEITVPTLIVHAKDDPLASYEDARRMAQRIPNARFEGYESGGHLVFGHADEIRQTVTEFATSPTITRTERGA